MDTLSNTVDRKFLDSIDLDDWEIDTEQGWKDLTCIHKTVPYSLWRIELENGMWLEAADDHIVILSDGSECFVKDLIPNVSNVQTKQGASLCLSTVDLNKDVEMFDPEVNSDSHLYWSNGILSHNTITVAAFLLWVTIFNRDKTVGILANNATKSREILSRIKLMYEELPWWLKPGVIEWNKSRIKFSNGGIMFAGPTSEASLRGYSINILYLDEFAFVDNDVEFYTSAYPVLSSGKTTKLIITSTPKGINLFYKIWIDAINKHNDFNYRLYTWKDNPTKDEAWRKETLRNMSPRQFAQEHECKFFGSSSTLVSGESLELLSYIDPLNEIDEESDYLRVFELPEEDHFYVACVDVSEGIGKDYSTIQVIKISEKPYKQVCVYRRNDISPWSFPDVVEEVGVKYNNAYLMVESNAIGKIVADTLYSDREYENMLSSTLKRGTEIVNEFSLQDIGLKMSKRTKSAGCSALKTAIEENFLLIQDWRTIQELTSFIKVGNTYKAEKNKHDDLIMPLVMFAWLTTQPLFEDLASEQMQDLIKQRREEGMDDSHELFGFFSDGTEYM